MCPQQPEIQLPQEETVPVPRSLVNALVQIVWEAPISPKIGNPILQQLRAILDGSVSRNGTVLPPQEE